MLPNNEQRSSLSATYDDSVHSRSASVAVGRGQLGREATSLTEFLRAPDNASKGIFPRCVASRKFLGKLLRKFPQ